MRAFIALTLSAEAREAVRQLQEALAASRADVKWVRPDQVHLTLKFLDDITELQRQEIELLLGRVARVQPPFLMGIAEIGAFPSLAAPRTLWVGVSEGAATVTRLAEAIEQEAAAIPPPFSDPTGPAPCAEPPSAALKGGGTIALRKEARPFAAHVTIGRVRSSRNRSSLIQALRAATWQPPAPWRVSSITLYHSVLTPEGPHYTVLAEFPFG